MVEFKAVISNPKDGKSYQLDVTKHHANSLVGKRIGEEIDGIFVSLPGYKLSITGGSDKDGFPMRKDLPGIGRKRILLTEGTGFKTKHKGKRKRKLVRGNTISPEIVQINLKITQMGMKQVGDLLAPREEAK